MVDGFGLSEVQLLELLELLEVLDCQQLLRLRCRIDHLMAGGLGSAPIDRDADTLPPQDLTDNDLELLDGSEVDLREICWDAD